MKNKPSVGVVWDLQYLGLKGTKIIITDRINGLERAMEEFEAYYVFCREHFLATLGSAASGLQGSKRVKFNYNLRDVLTGSFAEEKDFDQLVGKFLVKFEDEAKQISLRN
eukprot:snap_masked-scaffold_12-processed-gene-12.22-mRNA-1 protein AED:1.00 eAED:1.00 QI:0/-1/0/0/-1/1/1/0/109